MEIRKCKKCGFILGTRPGLLENDGVCMACINAEKKKHIDFVSRQEWLQNYLDIHKGNGEHDCVVAVSGGKDSHSIVKRLIENHGVTNPLLVNIQDDFTKTQAGIYNINNLVQRYNLDILTYRFSPQTFREKAKENFKNELHPLKWFENKISEVPTQIANKFGIKLVFYGENPTFEYGASTELEIFDRRSTDDCKIIYLGAIYPYSILDAYDCARSIGFKTLDDFNEWQREGNIENFTQIDSMGYLMQIWTKFIKFGFQRVSDIACRFVREGVLNKEQAELLIRDKDYICDSAAKRDFCNIIGLSEQEFNDTVDKFANRDLLVKDVNGNWRRRDLI